MSKRWYVIHTKTGAEELAARNLRRQDFDIFLPLSYRSLRHARQIKTTRSAFFPGYVFAAIDVDIQRWRAIDGTFGVRALIKANDRPLPAPMGLVETLQGVSDADGVLDLARDLQPGAPVRVIGGPFADQLGAVERMSGAGRVHVLLSMMGQSVPVELPRNLIATL